MKNRFTLFLTSLLILLFSTVSASVLAYAYTENYHKEQDGYISEVKDGEFTLAVIGDTQCCVEVESRVKYLEDSHNWLVDNTEKYNLAYALMVGDIVNDVEDPNNGEDKDVQWKRADSVFKILDDAKIPQAIIPGNHDYLGYKNGYVDKEKFDEYFPVSRYNWLESMIATEDPLSMENSYHFFTAGGEEYMIMALGYKPTSTTLAWADGIIKANTDKKVIVITHSYLDEKVKKNSLGDLIFESIVYGNDNVFMVVCGHSIPENGVDSTISFNKFGNPVQEVICDMQYFEDGGKGNLLLMTFREDGTVDCNTYCPTTNEYLNSAFVLNLTRRYDDLSLASGAKVEGNVNDSSFACDYSIDGVGWKNSAYSHLGIKNNGDGLVADGDAGYVTYAISAGYGNVFTSLGLKLDYSLINGDMQIYVGEDLDNLAIYATEEKSVQYGKSALNLTKFALNNASIYVKIVLNGDAVLDSAIVETATHKILDNTASGTLSIHKDFTVCEDYDIASWTNEALTVSDVLTFGGYLGTGKQSSYAGAEGYIVYRFACENKLFETFKVTINGRLGGADNGYAVRVKISLNGGQTYTLIGEEKVGQPKYSGVYDATGLVKGKKDIMLRIELYGDYWHSVGLTDLSIEGTYRFFLNYELDGGELEEKNPESYLSTDAQITLNTPKQRDYYTFGGWYSDGAYTKRVESIPADVEGSVTLYAKWIADAFNIEYNLNGGKNSGNPSTLTHYEELVLSDATRNGYKFMGWYSSEDFSGERITAISGITADIELYAKFLKNYRITYVLGGGTLQDKVETFTQEDVVELSTPTMAGYTFEGWYTDSAFTNKIERIESGSNSAITLYAKWCADGENSDSSAKKAGCAGSLNCGSLAMVSALLAIRTYKNKQKLK